MGKKGKRVIFKTAISKLYLDLVTLNYIVLILMFVSLATFD